MHDEEEELRMPEKAKKDVIKKVVLLGIEKTGKTTLIKRYVHDIFSERYKSTIGVDFSLKQLTVGDTCLRLQLWDVGSDSIVRSGSMMRIYLKDTAAVVMVYNSADKASLDSLEEVYSTLSEHLKGIPLCYIGTHSDMREEEEAKPHSDASKKKVVSDDEVQSCALRIRPSEPVRSFMVSSKTDEGVKDAFYSLAKYLTLPHVRLIYVKNCDEDMIRGLAEGVCNITMTSVSSEDSLRVAIEADALSSHLILLYQEARLSTRWLATIMRGVRKYVLPKVNVLFLMLNCPESETVPRQAIDIFLASREAAQLSYSQARYSQLTIDELREFCAVDGDVAPSKGFIVTLRCDDDFKELPLTLPRRDVLVEALCIVTASSFYNTEKKVFLTIGKAYTATGTIRAEKTISFSSSFIPARKNCVEIWHEGKVVPAVVTPHGVPNIQYHVFSLPGTGAFEAHWWGSPLIAPVGTHVNTPFEIEWTADKHGLSTWESVLTTNEEHALPARSFPPWGASSIGVMGVVHPLTASSASYLIVTGYEKSGKKSVSRWLSNSFELSREEDCYVGSFGHEGATKRVYCCDLDSKALEVHNRPAGIIFVMNRKHLNQGGDVVSLELLRRFEALSATSALVPILVYLNKEDDDKDEGTGLIEDLLEKLKKGFKSDVVHLQASSATCGKGIVEGLRLFVQMILEQ
eukprot:TRINITY_DN10094_c0_g1_i1.p1 TRINITY_DN10094_c0_g1~~TRINITY_DN10094_c0_g1_i1.p1  ORF type:complete len:688 (+),score=82.30 TRINITY_DN10094_c0_g1_i1:144-2207(+)